MCVKLEETKVEREEKETLYPTKGIEQLLRNIKTLHGTLYLSPALYSLGIASAHAHFLSIDLS